MKNNKTQNNINCTVAEIEDQINEMFFDEVNITKKVISELVKVCWDLNDSFNEVSEVTYKHVKEIKNRIKNGGNTEEVFYMLEKELKSIA